MRTFSSSRRWGRRVPLREIDSTVAKVFIEEDTARMRRGCLKYLSAVHTCFSVARRTTPVLQAGKHVQGSLQND